MMKQDVIEKNGRDEPVVYENVAGKLWVHFKGETYCFEPEKRTQRKSGKGSKSEPGQIRALMPGKILKVMVKEGENVEEGAPLIAMEAMKMEYLLKADVSGCVESVGCSVGDQVTMGQNLVSVVGE